MMRAKEFSAPLATARGHHPSGLFCFFKLTSQSVGLIHQEKHVQLQNYRMLYFNNLHIYL